MLKQVGALVEPIAEPELLQTTTESLALSEYGVISMLIFCNSRSNSSKRFGIVSTSLKIIIYMSTCPISGKYINKKQTYLFSLSGTSLMSCV